jgi:hypothetical protein
MKVDRLDDTEQSNVVDIRAYRLAREAARQASIRDDVWLARVLARIIAEWRERRDAAS